MFVIAVYLTCLFVQYEWDLASRHQCVNTGGVQAGDRSDVVIVKARRVGTKAFRGRVLRGGGPTLGCNHAPSRKRLVAGDKSHPRPALLCSHRPSSAALYILPFLRHHLLASPPIPSHTDPT
nr:unnamed protein product [Digitaria exilis]